MEDFCDRSHGNRGSGRPFGTSFPLIALDPPREVFDQSFGKSISHQLPPVLLLLLLLRVERVHIHRTPDLPTLLSIHRPQ